MYNRIKRLWLAGALTAAALAAAVLKGWITKQQAEELEGINEIQD
jgi:hypothetical protein